MDHHATGRQTRISPEKARAILDHTRADDYTPGADYWIVTTEEGEFLFRGGDDEPTAENTETTSWHSPGFPSELD